MLNVIWLDMEDVINTFAIVHEDLFFYSDPPQNSIYLADSLQCFWKKKYLPSQLAAAIKRGLKNADDVLEVIRKVHTALLFLNITRGLQCDLFLFL